jgi:hypothetical protein
MQEQLELWRSVQPEEIGVAVTGDGEGPAVLSFWHVEYVTSQGDIKITVLPIAVRPDGSRVPAIERRAEAIFHCSPSVPVMPTVQRKSLVPEHIETAVQRELRHKGMANGDGSYASELIGWVEVI